MILGQSLANSWNRALKNMHELHVPDRALDPGTGITTTGVVRAQDPRQKKELNDACYSTMKIVAATKRVTGIYIPFCPILYFFSNESPTTRLKSKMRHEEEELRLARSTLQNERKSFEQRTVELGQTTIKFRHEMKEIARV